MAAHGSRARERADRLNESPSQKEGKLVLSLLLDDVFFASMKALPKRKGNWFSPCFLMMFSSPQ